MKAEVRIAYLLPNLESGGTERQLLALLRLLDRPRFDPFLVATAGGGALHDDFARLLPVTVFGDPREARRFRSRPADHLRTVAALARLFRRERPALLHASLPASNVLGPVAARLAGVPRVVIAKRSLAEYKARYPLLRRAETLGNRLADAIIANSEAVRRDVERTERAWEGKIRVVRNGVDPIPPWSPRERAAFRHREGIDPEAPVVLAVSNFYPYKGHGDLLRAAPEVAAAHPDALFLLVGRDAGTLPQCRALAAEAGLSRAVRFLGSRGDVPDLVRACDLFVHPSHEEGLSNAVLEAMAAGRAVVACAVGGNPEAVRDGETGLLVPARQPRALARAISGLLADPGRREAMGEAGRQRAAASFSMERMARETERVYDALAAGGG